LFAQSRAPWARSTAGGFPDRSHSDVRVVNQGFL